MAFLRSLPLVASVRSRIDEGLLGTVLDLQAAEVMAAFTNRSADRASVRDAVAHAIFRLSSGSDAIRMLLETRQVLGPEFARQAARHREVVAISRSDFGNADAKVIDLLKLPLRSPKDVQSHLDALQDRLSNDIRQHGDKRIPNSDQTSWEFLKEVGDLGR
jgi:hypothetical protein